MAIERIFTKRLILVPVTYDIISSLLGRDTSAVEGLGFKFNENWPRNDTFDVLEILSQVIDSSYEPKGYELWMIVKKEDMTVIGDIGFKGSPNEDGEIELGYGIVWDQRKKGYGFEAAEGLVKWAYGNSEVKVIKAECLIENSGSIRILQKLGMEQVYRDHELIYWEIKK